MIYFIIFLAVFCVAIIYFNVRNYNHWQMDDKQALWFQEVRNYVAEHYPEEVILVSDWPDTWEDHYSEGLSPAQAADEEFGEGLK